MNLKIKQIFTSSFIICAAILAVSAAAMSTALEKLDIYLTKLPLPLKAPLSELDVNKLKPYEVREKYEISNKDVIEQLGTEMYLQWLLEDPDVEKDSPVRFCNIFITYYTGMPDPVPHVPDECYVGAGNQRLSSEMIDLKIHPTNLPLNEDILARIPEQLSVRRVNFSNESNIWNPTKYSVLYFFHANGRYAGNRTETRSIMAQNLFNKYSYYAKVEWKFYGISYSRKMLFPDMKDISTASEKLLSHLCPILESDHWPDWEHAGKTKN